MRVTKIAAKTEIAAPVTGGRSRESALMAAAACLLVIGFWQVTRSRNAVLETAGQRLRSGQMILLRRGVAAADIARLVRGYDNTVADAISVALRDRAPANVGALARLTGAGRTRLFTQEEFATRIKPLFAVRTPGAWRESLRRWLVLFFGCFLATHLVWLGIGFHGNQYLLPAVFFLHGTGLILMIALRDPVRDVAIFAGFARGVLAGCLLLLAITTLWHFVERRRRGLFPRASALGRVLDLAGGVTHAAARRGNVAFAASIALSILLLVFGSGPGASGAKVRLGFFQPVEVIRFLLVLFLATYFARRWEFLRELKDERVRYGINVPRLDHALPAILALALSIVFFFLQRDLGPALVLSGVFLCLYAVARRRAGLVLVTFLALITVMWLGYTIGRPSLVVTRVGMWLDPWSNGLAGGDQAAHSFWALASGGVRGAGFGYGDPEMIPAGYTDLVLAVLGEERGFIGLVLMAAVFALLFWQALRIALRAATDYEFFLALGLTLALALEGVLIAGGVFGLLPLSGVVTPFLSYGASATLVNLAAIAILLAISAKPGRAEPNAHFRGPVRMIARLLGVFLVVLIVKAAAIEVARADQFAAAGALTAREDGSHALVYNPRLLAIAHLIPRGSIYDRNGLPLATSRWAELEKHRAAYTALGVDLDSACSREDRRHYPLGPAMFHLLGDLRTRWRWAASNARYEERVSRRFLQGFDDHEIAIDVQLPRSGKQVRVFRYDYSELVPLLRAGMDPEDDAVKKVLATRRDIRLPVDARLQLTVTRLFQEHLRSHGWSRGAVVVLQPGSGDLLAAVSLPLPHPDAEESDTGIDFARFGQYPPGSSFKLVTAVAALRKDPALVARTYQCVRLPGGRVGNTVRGRLIRDDVRDTHPHGTPDMRRALVESCNAYFSQLGTNDVGPQQLLSTALLFNIETASPNTPKQLGEHLTQAAYGQGEVLVTPYRMARVAAAIANGGRLPPARFRIDPQDPATEPGRAVLAPQLAEELRRAMRGVVTSGTGRAAAAGAIPIAGKTGTAELARQPAHAWFAGFAPYDGAPQRQVAFAILVENARYGGTAAAPFAVKLVEAVSLLDRQEDKKQ